MFPRKCAILAVISAVMGVGPLPTPLQVRFKLADGVLVNGRMTAWDHDGFDGTFGRRRWIELTANDTWRLYRRLMNRDSGADWVRLGAALLMMPGGEAHAETAFTRANTIDPDSEAEVTLARTQAASYHRHQQELRDAIDAQRLNTRSPEAEPWDATPWPASTAAQQTAAVDEMKRDAAERLTAVGLQIKPMETDHFLFYSDMEGMEAARFARRLDRIHDDLSMMLARDNFNTIFFGKAVVFVFSDQDRFRVVEADAFKQLVSLGTLAICHYDGPKVFINAYRHPDDEQFTGALAKQVTYGFMHRYRSPKRLPAWANDGLAEYVATSVIRNGFLAQDRRDQGLDYIRAGNSVRSVLATTYDNEAWPGPMGVGSAVGLLLVDLMITQQPFRFNAWVNAVKDGRDWAEALRTDYGVSPQNFAATAAQYYRVND